MLQWLTCRTPGHQPAVGVHNGRIDQRNQRQPGTFYAEDVGRQQFRVHPWTVHSGLGEDPGCFQ
ncbi:hypothetical protein GCM10029964_108340 [Kibdelosporangium lantanae]